MTRTIFIGRVSLHKCFFQTLAIKSGLRYLNFHSTGFYRNALFSKYNLDSVLTRTAGRAFSGRPGYGLNRSTVVAPQTYVEYPEYRDFVHQQLCPVMQRNVAQSLR